MILILLNVLRFALGPRIWSILVNIHVHLKRIYILLLFGEVFYINVN